MYSSVPNSRAGRNKHAGGKILEKRVGKNKRAEGNFFLKINKLADPNKTVQGEFLSQNF